MKYRIRHTTTYGYGAAVQVSHHAARLTPRDTPVQRCLTSSLRVEPLPARVDEARDYFGNWVAYFTLQQSHYSLLVEADSIVEVSPVPRFDGLTSPPWEEVRDRLARPAGERDFEAAEFAQSSPLVGFSDDIRAYALQSFPAGRPLLEAARDLTGRIHRDFLYDPMATSVATPLAQVLAMRRGVCQDFAHLQVASLRAMGLAARYVSGYLLTRPPPGQVKLVGSDASHAWISVYAPGLGWVDFDPTNDMAVGDEHITCGWGRDYEDVSPIKGVVIGGGEHTIYVEVDVSVA